MAMIAGLDGQNAQQSASQRRQLAANAFWPRKPIPGAKDGDGIRAAFGV